MKITKKLLSILLSLIVIFSTISCCLSSVYAVEGDIAIPEAGAPEIIGFKIDSAGNISGYVDPNDSTTRITATITNTTAVVIQTQTATTPAGVPYYLEKLNFDFSKLTAGIYSLTIRATNVKGGTAKTISFNSPDLAPLSVEIPDKMDIYYKKTATIVPKVSGGSGKYSYSFISSNQKILTVDSKGNITSVIYSETQVDGMPISPARMALSSDVYITCIIRDTETGQSVDAVCAMNIKLKWWEWLIYIFLFGWGWY